ncbi:MAG TPA: S9 family peptidase [Pyrinomonadaceae bacterium]|jgi:dipeptidyl aminopeptidase/acylaminoacyl peptidase|nr:S9 family peptidase [Pyrinomonadaceae bacterium]
MKSVLFVCVVLFVLDISGQPSGYSIQEYLNIKSASGPTFSTDGKSIAYLSNTTGTMQVWSIALPYGTPHQLTNYDDNVGFVRWLGDGSGLVFGKAKGGDENTQFFWMKPDGSGVKALTDEPKVRHNFSFVTDDGKTIAYSSNKRDPQFFDIYKMDLASGEETLLYKQDGSNSIAAMNGAQSKIIVNRDGTELSLDNNLYLVDVATGGETLLTPHTGSSQFGDANFVADGIIFGHDNGREFYGLAQMRRKNAATDDWNDKNREVRILDETPWDMSGVTMSTYGNTIAYTINHEGFSELYLRKYETDGKPLITVVDKKSTPIKLPGQGIVGGVTFNKDESQIAFSFSSSTRNSDIWIYDRATQKLSQVSHSDTAGVSLHFFVEPKLIRYRSFDGREISAWYYEPERQRSFALNVADPKDTKLHATWSTVPVIVSVHGGPEAQERPGFNALYQYYLSRGYAVLATNVRGSTGYGKTFTHLDDVKKREDSVRDLAYAVDWLKTKGGADAKRIAVMGGSYGGYMTLAAITLYPELWAAAVDTVGISNWETFLNRTSGYRRRQREVEYGRLDKDLDFLRSVSPMTKIDRIKTPLFVIAGRNDPRVPWTEGQQIVDALKKRNSPVEWKLYDDEGHGVSKLKNRLELYPLVADFLDKYMK